MSFLSKLRQYLKTNLKPEQLERLAKFQALRYRSLQHFVYLMFIGSNLKALATVNNTDKWNGHYYAKHYETHFSALRFKKLNILEIGIGGYGVPEKGGGSLRMWRIYFPRSRIYGIDIYDKSLHHERRIKTFKGSQIDCKFLEEVISTIGTVDIIIDDGSHVCEHVIRSFEFLFPKLNQNGIYVIEDTQTSYWPKYGGSNEELNSRATTMGFFKSLIDGLNCDERGEKYEPTYYDRHIVAMHFYHDLIFIQKGINNEGSPFLEKIRRKNEFY